MLQALIDSRRPAARMELKTPEEEDEEARRKREAYLKLADLMDDYDKKDEAKRRELKGRHS